LSSGEEAAEGLVEGREWTRRAEEPLAERRCVVVGARAKTSAGWTAERVWVVRYCFDWVVG
jgi:hypothetical protein